MLLQDFSVIIYLGISSLVHFIEVVYGPNDIDKRFIFQLMPIVQLPGEKLYGIRMVMHTVTCTSDVSLDKEFQKHLSNAEQKSGLIYHAELRLGYQTTYHTRPCEHSLSFGPPTNAADQADSASPPTR